MPESVKQWLPGALDQLQGWKRLIQLAMNILVILALCQVSGVDVGALTQGNVVPPLPWWGTGALAAVLVLVEARISNLQESRKLAGLDIVPLVRDATR